MTKRKGPAEVFTAKHYDWLARWLSGEQFVNAGTEDVVSRLVYALEHSHPKFDRRKFMKAVRCVSHTGVYTKELKNYKRKNGEVVVLSREPQGYYAVECFDSSDISRWRKSFTMASDADVEYERWRD